MRSEKVPVNELSDRGSTPLTFTKHENRRGVPAAPLLLWFDYFIRFNFAIEAMVGIFIGQTSIQDSAFEQVLPKCSP